MACCCDWIRNPCGCCCSRCDRLQKSVEILLDEVADIKADVHKQKEIIEAVAEEQPKRLERHLVSALTAVNQEHSQSLELNFKAIVSEIAPPSPPDWQGLRKQLKSDVKAIVSEIAPPSPPDLQGLREQMKSDVKGECQRLRVNITTDVEEKHQTWQKEIKSYFKEESQTLHEGIKRDFEESVETQFGKLWKNLDDIRRLLEKALRVEVKAPGRTVHTQTDFIEKSPDLLRPVKPGLLSKEMVERMTNDLTTQMRHEIYRLERLQDEALLRARLKEGSNHRDPLALSNVVGETIQSFQEAVSILGDPRFPDVEAVALARLRLTTGPEFEQAASHEPFGGAMAVVNEFKTRLKEMGPTQLLQHLDEEKGRLEETNSIQPEVTGSGLLPRIPYSLLGSGSVQVPTWNTLRYAPHSSLVLERPPVPQVMTSPVFVIEPGSSCRPATDPETSPPAEALRLPPCQASPTTEATTAWSPTFGDTINTEASPGQPPLPPPESSSGCA
mmetsp:Transcript_86716/g.190340  ORF Transcript_86716/g.190340 Transcript_86716/m.190340 type:complete len:500 (-) Transcript_86716:319-1818(-)